MAERSMSSAQGKALLALARGGDFAHPGEIDSVVSVLSRLPNDPLRSILDVGCGRGGTAGAIADRGLVLLRYVCYGLCECFESAPQ
jgi:2-polyprenyl-3-methyl-5-hydroxy-6-metoxy-1,4-benzoquinol methylase